MCYLFVFCQHVLVHHYTYEYIVLIPPHPLMASSALCSSRSVYCMSITVTSQKFHILSSMTPWRNSWTRASSIIQAFRVWWVTRYTYFNTSDHCFISAYTKIILLVQIDLRLELRSVWFGSFWCPPQMLKRCMYVCHSPYKYSIVFAGSPTRRRRPSFTEARRLDWPD